MRIEAEKQAVAYMRVSTSKQGGDGLSIGDQREVLMDFADRQGIEVIQEFVEVESGTGSEADRPMLAAAIDMCKEEGATLIIVRLDRLFRSVYLTSKLMDSKVKFVCCDMPEANDLTIHVMAAVAEQQVRSIRSNTKAAMREIKRRILEQGSYTSRSGRVVTKLGRDFSTEDRRKGAAKTNAARKASPEREKTKRIIRILMSHRDGNGKCTYTIQGICDELDSVGIKSQSGKKWSTSSVHGLMKEVQREIDAEKSESVQ